MTNLLPLTLALLTGAILGALFFGGLWWTIQRGLTSNHPALWFFGSNLLRTALVMAGFFLISSGDWRKLMACLLGFFIARVLVTRFTRTSGEGPNAPK